MFFSHLYFVFTDRDTDTVGADFDKQNGRRSTGSTGSDGHDIDNKEAVATLKRYHIMFYRVHLA
jgi:hypothetical protein